MERSPLGVRFTLAASGELKGIYLRTASDFGERQAGRYEDFLVGNIESLIDFPEQGEELATRPGLRRITLKWRGSRHGHVVIYRADGRAEAIDILHIYHTSMDIGARLDEDLRKDET